MRCTFGASMNVAPRKWSEGSRNLVDDERMLRKSFLLSSSSFAYAWAPLPAGSAPYQPVPLFGVRFRACRTGSRAKRQEADVLSANRKRSAHWLTTNREMTSSSSTRWTSRCRSGAAATSFGTARSNGATNFST